MSLPTLPQPAAHAAWLLGGREGRRGAPASDEEAALVSFLIEQRLAAEIAAILPKGHALSRAAVRSLAVERERIRAMAVARARTLMRSGEALACLGLRALLFKGEATIRLTHGDASRRPMADIDIVARPGELDAVVAALGDAGFARTAHDTPLHVVLVDAPAGGVRGAVHVEVHSDVLSPPHPVHVDLEGTFARAAPAAEPGLLVPDPADALVLSALHLALHENDARKTLLTLRDIALLLERIAADGGGNLARHVAERDAGAIVAPIIARAVAWAGAPQEMAGVVTPERPRLRRRLAAALALAELDETVVSSRPRPWRVLGRRLGTALWWPRRVDSARAVAALLFGRKTGGLLRPLTRVVAALTRVLTPRRRRDPPR